MEFPNPAPVNLELDPAKTALIVVDMQNDFCHPEGEFMKGPWDATEFNQAIGPNVDLVAKVRAAGATVVFTRIMHELGNAPNDRPNRMMSRRAVPRKKQAIVKGTWGVEVVDELKPQAGDLVIDKEASSAFLGTNLDAELKARGIETVIVTGVVTYACVLATALGARDRSYNVVMVKEAVGSFWSELNEPVFRMVNFLMGHAINSGQLSFRRKAIAA
jgi:nicotinamidase-related amidase